MAGSSKTLHTSAMGRYDALQAEALQAVTARFHARHAACYEQFGAQGLAACRDDLAFLAEFLRAVLEFGVAQPMADYLRWLEGQLSERSLEDTSMEDCLDGLAEFFARHMPGDEGKVIAGALAEVRQRYLFAERLPQAAPPQPWPECGPFAEAIVAGSLQEAQALLQGCLDAGNSLVAVELHVVQPALYRVGERWRANEISVAQEHMATAITNAAMTAMLVQQPAPARNGKRVLLACVQDNRHAMGLRMVADAFQMDGWDVQYLGADVPTADLVRQVEAWRPDLVGLSLSFPHQLLTAKAVISALESAMGASRPPVIVGGLAFSGLATLGAMIGADAQGADAQAAVSRGGRLAAMDGAR